MFACGLNIEVSDGEGEVHGAVGKCAAHLDRGWHALIRCLYQVGVINPPPDLRQIVDKTAMFVAKNGKKFEAK